MKKKYVKIITIIIVAAILLTATYLALFEKKKGEISLRKLELEGIYYYENGNLHVNTSSSAGQSDQDELLFFDTNYNKRSHGTVYVTPGTKVYFDAGAYGIYGYSWDKSNNLISLSSDGGLYVNDINGTVSSTASLGQTFSVTCTVKRARLAGGNTSNTINFQIAWGETLKFNVNNSNSSNTYANQELFTADSNAKSITWTLPTTNPTATGYTFLGWYDGNTYAGKAGDTYTKSYSSDNNTTTLTAKWEVASYTVSFNSNGGTGTMNNGTFISGTATALPTNTFTREGYDFAGWSTNSNATTPEYTDGQQISFKPGDGTLYAVWTLTNYSVNYNLNGGTNSASNPTTFTMQDNVTLQDATKTGYTFNGWYTDSNFNNKVTTIPAGTTSNITLYAKFTPNPYKYRIRYFYQNLDNDNYTEDINLSEEKIANYGTEIDYYTDKTKTGFKVNATNPAKLTVTEIESNNNLNVYYNREKFQISFTAPGASTVPGQRVKYEGTVVKPADPTRPGYIFDKWYIDTDFDGVGDEVYDFNTQVNSEIALVATWTLANYTVTYNLQADETNSSNNPTTVTINDNIILEQATKQGYDFAGWVDNNNNPVTKLDGTTQNIILRPTWTPAQDTPYRITYTFEGLDGEEDEVKVENYTGITDSEVDISDKLEKYNTEDFGFELDTANSTIKDTIKPDGTTEFKVRYKRKTYTVTYDTNGGDPMQPDSKKYEETINKEPARTGYIFDGWTLDGNDFDENTKIDKDMTLVAKWKPDKTTYNVEYYLENLDGSFSLYKVDKPEAYVEDSIVFNPPAIDGFKPDTENELYKGTGEVVPNGDLTLKIYYKRNEYSIKYIVDENVKEETVKFEDKANGIKEPIKEGYTFGGWLYKGQVYDLDTQVTDNLILTPNWIPNKDTKYTVRYYKTNPDGTYELIKEVVLEGTTDEEVEAEVENIDGLKVNKKKSTLKTKILPDGTAVLEVFYDVNDLRSVATGDMILIYIAVLTVVIAVNAGIFIAKKKKANKN